MADVAVGYLSDSLREILKHHAELSADQRNQVEALKHELDLYKGVLKDLTENSVNSYTLEELANNIRVLVDKAEDAIQNFIVQKEIFKSRNSFGKVKHRINYSVRIGNIEREIENVRKDVQDIHKQEQTGKRTLQQLKARPESEKKRPEVEKYNVVGFDKEAKTVAKRLTEGPDEDLEIITIIGMPGLGKTTLARKIYNDLTAEGQIFQSTHAWVYISEKYNKKEALLEIVSSFMMEPANYANKSEEFIIGELQKHLTKKKFLIVMDDVWTLKAWDDLKNIFPNDKNGSRILITSQQKEVAIHARPTKGPHYLKFLTPEESWELLEKKIYDKGKCPGDLQTLGEQIAAECTGLPLAIEVIARILLKNHELRDRWEQVHKDVSSFLATDELFMDVLAKSYKNLSYHMKSCFLYLGVFPEGHAIPVWKLIRLWIAEGFIVQEEKRSLEDIAEDWIEELVKMNLLMVARKGYDGRIKTCRVHDMLYNFCKRVAGKQNFYQELKRSDQVALDDYRRVCIQSDAMDYISTKRSGGERVHSFLSFDPEDITLPREHISTIPKAFKLLRVLDIISITFDIFPKDLLQLSLLRYIAISCNIKALPSSISNLWSLQTLIFITASRTLELTRGIWKMQQLRHLRTNASALLPRPPLSDTSKGWENVQSLTTVSPESCSKHALEWTLDLKKLGVRGNLVGHIDNLFDNVARLENLTNLKLFNDVLSVTSSERKIRSLPPLSKFPSKLKKLTLSGTWLDWKLIHVLGQLENLEVLKLKDNAFTGKNWVTEDGSFLSLKHLHIGKTNLVTWKASTRQFRSLKRLVLQYCEKLEAVPSGLADAANFQILELYYTNEKAAASARALQQKTMQEELGQGTKTGGGFNLYIYPPDV